MSSPLSDEAQGWPVPSRGTDGGPRAEESGRVASASPSPLVTVATLRVGQEVDSVFACSRKERLLSKTGTPYLTVELRDRTGAIVARAFRDADLLAGRFERGELVRVQGRVESYREQPQIELRAIASARGAHADPVDFLPTAHRDLEELEGFLEHLAREVYDPGLRGLLEGVLGDRELRAELRRAPCSIPRGGGGGAGGTGGGGGPGRAGGGTTHHAYLGGLLEHTVALATMALELCTVHQRLDRDLLLTAALVHDVGKTREFTYGAEIARSEEGRLLGHVELGLRVLARHTPAALGVERRLALEHCVIAHHGGEGGGQRPVTGEAIALYRLNALDAHLKGAFEYGLPSS
jgi:3'-5' exoribonuclease